MDGLYIKSDFIGSDLTDPFIRSWIFMLVLGALGDQLHHPILQISYWTSFLVIWAASLLQRSSLKRFKISKRREFGK